MMGWSVEPKGKTSAWVCWRSVEPKDDINVGGLECRTDESNDIAEGGRDIP